MGNWNGHCDGLWSATATAGGADCGGCVETSWDTVGSCWPWSAVAVTIAISSCRRGGGCRGVAVWTVTTTVVLGSCDGDGRGDRTSDGGESSRANVRVDCRGCCCGYVDV